MTARIGWLLLALAYLGGCAHPSSGERAIQTALQERAAAYTRLAHAIFAYCEAGHASMEARRNCAMDKQIEILTLVRLREAELTLSRPLPPDLLGTTSVSWVKCERVARQTACRLSLAFAPSTTP